VILLHFPTSATCEAKEDWDACDSCAELKEELQHMKQTLDSEHSNREEELQHLC
jgi:hypothetical protein